MQIFNNISFFKQQYCPTDILLLGCHLKKNKVVTGNNYRVKNMTFRQKMFNTKV